VNRDKIYFASDFHLGYPTLEKGKERERKVVAWLDAIKHDAKEIYLMGDIFDFWYEYKWVVPRGHVRFLGKLAELVDCGIIINLFTGNHDVWYFDYLPSEIGINIYRDPLVKTYNNKSFFLHHGHGLGKYDRGMNFLKWMFENHFLQWCFSRLHPNSSFGFAHRWSLLSRKAKSYESVNYLGEEKEWLIRHSQEILKTEHHDFFIYGHRHVAMDRRLNSKSRYINLGNWLGSFTYAVFDGENVRLHKFNSAEDMPLYYGQFDVD